MRLFFSVCIFDSCEFAAGGLRLRSIRLTNLPSLSGLSLALVERSVSSLRHLTVKTSSGVAPPLSSTTPVVSLPEGLTLDSFVLVLSGLMERVDLRLKGQFRCKRLAAFCDSGGILKLLCHLLRKNGEEGEESAHMTKGGGKGIVDAEKWENIQQPGCDVCQLLLVSVDTRPILSELCKRSEFSTRPSLFPSVRSLEVELHAPADMRALLPSLRSTVGSPPEASPLFDSDSEEEQEGLGARPPSPPSPPVLAPHLQVLDVGVADPSLLIIFKAGLSAHDWVPAGRRQSLFPFLLFLGLECRQPFPHVGPHMKLSAGFADALRAACPRLAALSFGFRPNFNLLFETGPVGQNPKNRGSAAVAEILRAALAFREKFSNSENSASSDFSRPQSRFAFGQVGGDTRVFSETADTISAPFASGRRLGKEGGGEEGGSQAHTGAGMNEMEKRDPGAAAGGVGVGGSSSLTGRERGNSPRWMAGEGVAGDGEGGDVVWRRPWAFARWVRQRVQRVEMEALQMGDAQSLSSSSSSSSSAFSFESARVWEKGAASNAENAERDVWEKGAASNAENAERDVKEVEGGEGGGGIYETVRNAENRGEEKKDVENEIWNVWMKARELESDRGARLSAASPLALFALECLPAATELSMEWVRKMKGRKTEAAPGVSLRPGWSDERKAQGEVVVGALVQLWREVEANAERKKWWQETHESYRDLRRRRRVPEFDVPAA
uniref:Uncharacterized protein n=1 Tax=Chromera velia CCMP2878 TaxID=1169474 RepID=A0A0G4GIP8_9ALVE|eukprot:Cvel_22024.t1-p1 / transcript=Cvel_22024.t1 / gene=Cvel_22024 / organism=Chromera_velia_CCMP2878 / gene_product=hypothetical protein / transcript_product=hypothetical protein / location=Cvel_scaffold2124:30668-33390(-) / protein_length=722 / sequence_SO=supercontig / SO=protein_coding / is_pseudo=false